jgi:hypothetical protein
MFKRFNLAGRNFVFKLKGDQVSRNNANIPSGIINQNNA